MTFILVAAVVLSAPWLALAGWCWFTSPIYRQLRHAGYARRPRHARRAARVVPPGVFDWAAHPACGYLRQPVHVHRTTANAAAGWPDGGDAA